MDTKTKRKSPPRPEQQPQLEPGDNTRYIRHSLRLWALGDCDMADNEKVAQRVHEYFVICMEEDMKPSMAGLALALGIDRTTLWRYINGALGKNPDVRNTLKKAGALLNVQMEDYMQNGKINPVSGIFLMKNNFGYADKQEVVLTPQSPLGDTKDTKELEARYLESVAPALPEPDEN